MPSDDTIMGNMGPPPPPQVGSRPPTVMCATCYVGFLNPWHACSVVDRHRVDADPDPTFLFDADPDPDPTSKFYTCWKSDFCYLLL